MSRWVPDVNASMFEHFDYISVVRNPARNVRGIGFARGRHFRGNQFAFSGDRQRYPFGFLAVTAHRDQVKAASQQALANQFFSHVAHWNDAAAAQDHAFHIFGPVRKTENAAGRDEFRNLAGDHGKPTLT